MKFYSKMFFPFQNIFKNLDPSYRATANRDNLGMIFLIFSIKTYIVTLHPNRLAKTVLMCQSVHLSVVCSSVRTSFPFDNLSIYKRISFKFCICVCIKNVSLGIDNGQISIIYHRVMALVSGQYYLEHHAETSQK